MSGFEKKLARGLFAVSLMLVVNMDAETGSRQKAPAQKTLKPGGDPAVELAVRNGVPVFLAGGKQVAGLAAASGKTTSLYQMYRDGQNKRIAMQVTAISLKDSLKANYAGQGWIAQDEITRLGPRLFRGRRAMRRLKRSSPY